MEGQRTAAPNLVEVVETCTADGLSLHAALHGGAAISAGEGTRRACLLLHGTGSNFYASSLFRALVARFVEDGIACLAANTRGHDLVNRVRTTDGARTCGAAYEILDECRHDVAAWVGWLRQRGFDEIVLLGHSLGAVKAVYAMACEPPPGVIAVVAVSPPRLASSHFRATEKAALFESDLKRAQELVATQRSDELLAVQFPLPYVVTAASFVDKYGPAERYDVLAHVSRLATPLLVTLGARERSLPAFRGLDTALEEISQAESRVTLAVIPGADHVYRGAESDLYLRVARWLKRISL